MTDASTHASQLSEPGRVFTDHERALGAQSARRAIVVALRRLSECTDQPEGMAHADARVNAVMATVNALFPKSNAFEHRGSQGADDGDDGDDGGYA